MDIALSGLPTNTAQTTVQLMVPEGERRSIASPSSSREFFEKAVPTPDRMVTTASLEGAVSSIKDFVQTIRRDLNFDLDDSSGQMVVKVTDRTTGDVVRQIPTEEALRLAESLEEARSLLFEAKA